ncbi:MAG: hypothetical protein V4591_01560 [Bdellovibrionota bacterium]
MWLLNKKNKNHLKIVDDALQKAIEKAKEIKNSDIEFGIFKYSCSKIHIDPVAALKKLFTFRKCLLIFIAFAIGDGSKTLVYNTYFDDVMAISYTRDKLHDKCFMNKDYNKINHDDFEKMTNSYSVETKNMLTSKAYGMIPLSFGNSFEFEKQKVTASIESFEKSMDSCETILKEDPDGLHKPFRSLTDRMRSRINLHKILELLKLL